MSKCSTGAEHWASIDKLFNMIKSLKNVRLHHCTQVIVIKFVLNSVDNKVSQLCTNLRYDMFMWVACVNLTTNRFDINNLKKSDVSFFYN